MTGRILPAGRQDNPPVHEKTKIGPEWRYGCNNHPSRKENVYYAPNRVYLDDGTFYDMLKRIRSEWIEHDVCPAAHDEQGCIGCIHKQPAQKDCSGAQHHRYAGSFGD